MQCLYTYFVDTRTSLHGAGLTCHQDLSHRTALGAPESPRSPTAAGVKAARNRERRRQVYLKDLKEGIMMYHGYPFVGLVDLRFEIDEKGEEDSKGLKQSETVFNSHHLL